MAKTDTEQIAELMYGYGTAIDTRDWPLLNRSFAGDASFDYGSFGGRFRGIEALQRYLSEAVTPLQATQHQFANVVADLSPDGAQGTLRCSVIAVHVRRTDGGGEDILLIGGTYDNGVVRTADGWRIDRFRFTSSWASGDLAVVAEARAHAAG